MRRLLGRLRRIPVAARLCALVAVANAVVWSLLVPPFQVPDENAHVAYIQHLAETGEAPKLLPLPGASDELLQVQVAAKAFSVSTRPEERPIWSEAEQDVLERVLAEDLARDNGGGAQHLNPPLYYLLGTVPYGLGSGGDLLDRLALMRLLSALIAGLTVLFTFGFLRELLPGTPWAWTVGSLAVAFQPLFGFMSGGVSNDSLQFAAAAAVLFGLARAFRRGLSPRLAAMTGLAMGFGLVTKASLLAFVPGLLVAAGVLLRRARGERRRMLGRLGIAAGALAAPVAAYVLVNEFVWDRALYGSTSQFSAGTSEALGPSSSLNEQLSYLWQWYLPRLPFMDPQFGGGYYPLWENSFKGFIGRFGWVDYGFPSWVYNVALGVVVALLVLAGRELWVRRAALRRRAGELGAYVAAAVGLVLVIGVGGYGAREQGLGFEQARYFLPLLPLYGAIVALAARGAGRRFGPAAAAAIVVVVLAHSLFAQLITIARYYG